MNTGTLKSVATQIAIVLIAVLSFIGLVDSAGAGTSIANTQATATLVAVCNVSAIDISFGNIAGNRSIYWSPSNGSISVGCTKNTSYTIRLSAGVNVTNSGRRLRGATSGDLINYTICQTQTYGPNWSSGQCNVPWFTYGSWDYNLTGTGNGQTQIYTMHGVVQSDYYTPDNYSDTVTATVSF